MEKVKQEEPHEQDDVLYEFQCCYCGEMKANHQRGFSAPWCRDDSGHYFRSNAEKDRLNKIALEYGG